MNHEQRLREVYAAFNPRDIDAVPAALTEEVRSLAGEMSAGAR
jgi:hypothetical protein